MDLFVYVSVLLIAGLPAELPMFQSKVQLGEVSVTALHQVDDDDACDEQSDRSISLDAAVTLSANDSSVLDVDMDQM